MTTLLDILLEADKEPDAEEATNYSEETVEPEDVDDEATDYSSEGEDDPDEDTEGDPENDEPADGDGDETEPTDYTSEDEEPEEPSSDTTTDDSSSSTEEGESEEGDAERQLTLLDDFIDLFGLVKSIYERTLKVNLMDMEANRIIVQVSAILAKLKNEMFTYITMNYKKNSYVKNLYKFNQSSQTLNVVLGIIKNAKEIKLPDKKKRSVKH